MNPLLIEELFIHVCYQLSQVVILVKFEIISQWHKKVIRKNKWLNLPIQTKNDYHLILILETHNFSNLDSSYTKIIDISVFKLVNVYTLDLTRTKVRPN